jgi:hypothetical protein
LKFQELLSDFLLASALLPGKQTCAGSQNQSDDQLANKIPVTGLFEKAAAKIRKQKWE